MTKQVYIPDARVLTGLRQVQRFVGELLRLGQQRTQRRLTHRPRRHDRAESC